MMKRALTISTTVHLSVLLALWQVGRLPARHVMRGYPKLITATLIQKPAAAQATTAQEQTQSLAPVPAPPVPEPKKTVGIKPIPSTRDKKPAKVSPAPQTEKATPGSKENVLGAPLANQATGGATAGGIKIDAPEFPFPHYLALIQFRIENHWRPPYSGEGAYLATVYFKISRNGEILEVKLEQTSGSYVFDQAAVRAVHSANPLPPLPAGSGLETLGVHFDFVAN